jgi:hypothetical protein
MNKQKTILAHSNSAIWKIWRLGNSARWKNIWALGLHYVAMVIKRGLKYAVGLEQQRHVVAIIEDGRLRWQTTHLFQFEEDPCSIVFIWKKLSNRKVGVVMNQTKAVELQQGFAKHQKY